MRFGGWKIVSCNPVVYAGAMHARLCLYRISAKAWHWPGKQKGPVLMGLL